MWQGLAKNAAFEKTNKQTNKNNSIKKIVALCQLSLDFNVKIHLMYNQLNCIQGLIFGLAELQCYCSASCLVTVSLHYFLAY